MHLTRACLFATVVFSGRLLGQGVCAGSDLGPGANLNGFVPFPLNDSWNQDISGSAVDPHSEALLRHLGERLKLNPSFFGVTSSGGSIGLPYVVVSGAQPKVPIAILKYPTQSDFGPMPVPPDAPIQVASDHHVLVIDRDNCWLYELFHAALQPDGSWSADSTAVWDLLNGQQRPWKWTSADAAGLPVFPGLVRYDEVASGAINHALRFVVKESKAAIVPPATHFAVSSNSSLAMPMGARLRLKASVDLSAYPPQAQVILKALKRYGMFTADDGLPLLLTGAPDSRWDPAQISALDKIKASDFQVVLSNPVYNLRNLPEGNEPVIAGLTATPSVKAGSPVSLTWNVTGASYVIVSPEVGPSREVSAIVTPQQTTTYTLYATNQFGRTAATVTVKVP